MRLDEKVFLLGFASSKSQAQHLIKDQKVLVNGKVVTRPGKIISTSHLVTITEKQKYVSRGAYKLLHALNHWNIQVADKICADVGASTGGFTQVLIEFQAQKVYAIDVGTDQLHSKIKANEKVIDLPRTNIKQAELPEKVDLLVADLSFISIQKVFEQLLSLTKEKTEFVLLFKPQFEVGPENLNKKGVANPDKAKEALDNFINFLLKSYQKVDFTKSPVKGQDGNIEYLIYIAK